MDNGPLTVRLLQPPPPPWTRRTGRVAVVDAAGAVTVCDRYADGHLAAVRTARRPPRGMAVLDAAAAGPIYWPGDRRGPADRVRVNGRGRPEFFGDAPDCRPWRSALPVPRESIRTRHRPAAGLTPAALDAYRARPAADRPVTRRLRPPARYRYDQTRRAEQPRGAGIVPR